MNPTTKQVALQCLIDKFASTIHAESPHFIAALFNFIEPIYHRTRYLILCLHSGKPRFLTECIFHCHCMIQAIEAILVGVPHWISVHVNNIACALPAIQSAMIPLCSRLFSEYTVSRLTFADCLACSRDISIEEGWAS